MSGQPDDHASVVNSTLTELVLILLFGFMLVSIHYGVKANSIANDYSEYKSSQEQKDKDNREKIVELGAKIDELEWRVAEPCLRGRSDGSIGLFLLITERIDAGKLIVRLNDRYNNYAGTGSTLNLPASMVTHLSVARPYTIAELDRLARDLRAQVKPGKRCSIHLSVPSHSGPNSAMRRELDRMFNIGYYDP